MDRQSKVFEVRANSLFHETGERYWVSGVKKNGQDRHWAGSGKIVIDKKVIAEYLCLTGQESLDKSVFEEADIKDEYPVDRIHELENQRNGK